MTDNKPDKRAAINAGGVFGDGVFGDPALAAIAAAGAAAYVWRRDKDRIDWLGRLALGENGDVALPPTGAALIDMVHPRDRAIIRARLDGGETAAAYRVTYRVRDGNGAYHWIDDSGRLDGHDGAAGIMQLVPAHDAPGCTATGTPRRDKRYLCAAIDAHLQRGEQAQGCYLHIGVDRLSRINHAFGHAVGNKVLAMFGDCLDRVVGDAGITGHAGGDQFGALLPSLDEGATMRLAERLLKEVSESTVAIDAARLTVTVSAGLTELGGLAAGQQAMTIAHAALMQAKNEGRNRIAIHRPSTVAHGRGDLEMMNKVHDAIASGRVRLFYQPIVDAVSGQVKYHECLTRIVETDGSIVEAGRFMPLVEDMGLVRTIDRMALEIAVDELRRDPHARLAVNVSGYTVGDTAWIDLAHGLLSARADLAHRLVVEITETRTLGSLERAGAFAAALGDLGCKIALDDFGAGNTSFAQLKSMPIDILKIDRRFAYRDGDGPETQLFVRALVALAESLGMETVAEGIETDAAARIAREEGVTHMQGFLFGRPSATRHADERAPSRRKPHGPRGEGMDAERHRLEKVGTRAYHPR